MKQWLLGLGLLGLVQPTAAALFQQDAQDSAKQKESPIKVLIHGAPDDLTENLSVFMPAMRGLPCDASEARIQRLVEAAEPKLQDGAQAMGYYDATISVRPSQQDKCWVLNVDVNAGQPIKVSSVEVRVEGEGSNLKEFQDLRATLPYQVGDTLVQQQYEDFKTNLSRTASNLGFFEAEYLTREVKVDPDLHEAWVTLHFNTGKRYRIGAVAVSQDVLDDKYLKRYVRVKSGDFYDVDAIRKQRGILDGSGYYRSVDVLPQLKDAKDGIVPVEITTDRCKRYRYMWALGYGSNGKDSSDGNSSGGTECGAAIVTEQTESLLNFASDAGFRTTLRMDTRWVNKKGHKLVNKLRLGENKSSVEAVYRIPMQQPEHEYVDATLAVEKMNSNGLKVDGLKTGLDYNRRTPSDWQQKISIKHVNERITLDNTTNTNYLTLVGVKVKKTKKDDDLYPTKDWRLEAQLQGALKGVGSNQSVLQGRVTAKRLRTFENKDKLILQGSVGTTLTNDLNEMPVALRYFAGGQNSVRGYDLDSLGTRTASGAVIGGKHIVTTSVEYEKPIKDKWSAAAFVDAGNAFDDFNGQALKTGAGVGARWKSPVGPVRVDLAAPVDKPSDVHVYFSLGPDL